MWHRASALAAGPFMWNAFLLVLVGWGLTYGEVFL